jgi:hypothetical protein
MQLENITGTQNTPSVTVSGCGQFKMEGRSFPENVSKFFDPVIDYLANLECDNLQMDIFLEYFNTASSKKIMDMFMYADANNKIGKIQVTWRYEEGDEDSIDMAEIYEDSMRRAEFTYNEVAETY